MVPYDPHTTAYGRCSFCSVLAVSKKKRNENADGQVKQGQMQPWIDRGLYFLLSLQALSKQKGKRKKRQGSLGQFGAKSDLRCKNQFLIFSLNFTSIYW